MRPIEVEPTGPLTAPGSKVEIMLEGRGICLLFGPWNFPYQLVFAPLVPIIAAGNTAIVKPPPSTPLATTEPGHIGLASMKERAELIGGHLEIETGAEVAVVSAVT